jgi:hypothetical protein
MAPSQILEVTSSALASISAEARASVARAAKSAETKRAQEADRSKIVEQLETEGVRDGRMDAVAGIGVISELGGGIEKPEKEGAA